MGGVAVLAVRSKINVSVLGYRARSDAGRVLISTAGTSSTFKVNRMNEILHRLIMDHKGPWKDYSTDTRKQYRDICEAVAGQIIQSITGIHPDGCDGISAEYDFFNEEIFVYLTFQERATHTAEQIADAFKQHAGVSVNVKVWECVSEYKAK